MLSKRTMTLNLTEPEMEALETLQERHLQNSPGTTSTSSIRND